MEHERPRYCLTALRGFYLANNDLLIFMLVKNYFNSVAALMWRNDGRSYIRKTVGIQALFDILRLICTEAVEQKDVSQEFFVRRLEPCAHIDFADDLFQASGVGRQRIRNSLELCLRLRTLARNPTCSLQLTIDLVRAPSIASLP